MADCFLKSGQKRKPVAPGDVIKALEYFNIPENLWPEGLIAMAAMSTKFDLMANQLMNTIKSEIVAMAKSKYDVRTRLDFSVFTNNHQHQHENALILRPHTFGKDPLRLPAALEQRLQHHADDAFIQIKFNPTFFTVGTHFT